MGKQQDAKKSRKIVQALKILAAVIVPFYGAYRYYADPSGAVGAKEKRIILVSGVFAALVYAVVGWQLFKYREAEMVRGCADVLNGLTVLEQQYYIENGAYTDDIAKLGEIKLRFGAWLCWGLGEEECGERLAGEIARFCRMDTVSIEHEGDSGVTIKARARDTGACPICVTPHGYYPTDKTECENLSGYKCAGSEQVGGEQ